MENVYRPGEDSYLLARHVRRLVHGEVLDMGTGAGVQAVEAAVKPEVSRVVAVDVSPAAVEAAKRRAESGGVVGKIEFIRSDLFENVEGVFDWIVFNPPYLPSEGDADEASWAGGETGAETVRRFLHDAHKHLKKRGSILMVYSDHSGLDEDDFRGYVVEKLDELSLFFETLFCVALTPS
ncbi:methyltransferase [Candidatus Bathyarchaeota archaeon]|nr:methyltransferase [Candidatus Bathyarchaeota archaeon]